MERAGNSRSWPFAMALCGAFVLAFAPWAGAPGASVETLIVEPALDNTLVETPLGNLSNGAGDGLFAGRTFQGTGLAIRRAVLAFDLSAIPVGSTISGVELTLQLSQAIDPTARPFSLHRLTSGWGEGGSVGQGAGGGVGGPAEPGDTTWTHRFFGTETWSTPGGDFAPGASATLNVGGAGSYTWMDATLVTDAQGWLDDPPSNFGWILIGGEAAAGSARRFNSREHSTLETRPKLTVVYEPPVPLVSTTWGSIKSHWLAR